MKKTQWNPWHGCHKCSPGCLNCFVFYLDKRYKRETNVVVKSKTNFDLPLRKDRAGHFKIASGSEVATCFTSDFFIEEADAWRHEAWKIIRQRKDVNFLICTKRIERFNACLPDDWEDGYDHVFIAVTCENQEKINERLPIFLNVKAKHKYIFVSPILEDVDLSRYLQTAAFELVSVAGESYENARICRFDWVRHIKQTCDKYQVAFEFHQTGSRFVVKDRCYKISHHNEYIQAKRAMDFLEKEKLK